MNEIAIPTSLGKIRDEISKKMVLMAGLAIAPSNAKNYDTLRKENNDYIKAVKAEIDEARKRYLEPFEAEANKYLETLKNFETANKDFTARILEAKKVQFKEDMRREFVLMAIPDSNGEIPDFEKIYDPSWYSGTKTKAKEAMSARLKAFSSAQTKTEAYITFSGTKEQLAGLKKYCYENRLNVEITEMENE